jgi:hypothetical protein
MWLKAVPVDTETGTKLKHQLLYPSTKNNLGRCCWHHCTNVAWTSSYPNTWCLHFSFKHSEDVTINTQQSSGLFWDICTAVNRKHPSMLMTGIVTWLHFRGHCALCMLERVRPSCVQPGTFTLWLTCVYPPKKFLKDRHCGSGESFKA